MAQTLLIHHAAHRGLHYPPSSLGGLRECLRAGAQCIEVDIAPLAKDDFALVHDNVLDHISDGTGPVAAATPDTVRGLHYRWGRAVSAEPLGLLSQAIDLIAGRPGMVELQLDLKPHVPLTEAILRRLIRLVGPARDRVRISCVADWAVRGLAALDGDLALGFDPLLYLDLDGSGRDDVTPPFRMGAYGYRDDHPFASRKWGSAADYLAAHAEALWVQAPVPMWYIRGALLARVLDDGFDWIGWLHDRGAAVAAWTLDADQPHQLDLARATGRGRRGSHHDQ